MNTSSTFHSVAKITRLAIEEIAANGGRVETPRDFTITIDCVIDRLGASFDDERLRSTVAQCVQAAI